MMKIGQHRILPLFLQSKQASNPNMTRVQTVKERLGCKIQGREALVWGTTELGYDHLVPKPAQKNTEHHYLRLDSEEKSREEQDNIAGHLAE